MHVAFDGLGNGGIQAVIMGIVRNLKNDFNFDVLLFTNERRHYDDEFEKYGKIFRIPTRQQKSIIGKKIDYYTRFFKIYRGVKKILKENGPYDAIHCHNYFESGICTMAAKSMGVPVRISHSHSYSLHMHILYKIYTAFLKIIINRYSNVKISCSSYASSFLFYKKADTIIINNAVDLSKFNSDNYDFSNVPRFSFIHIGRFGEVSKNHSFLLEVFQKIYIKQNDARLTLIGFGTPHDEKRIKDKISILEIEKAVNILPHDTDIPLALSKSNAMIFPSKYEGFGIVIIEAQAMGVRCYISSDVIPKEVDRGLCTFISLKNNAGEWADIIINNLNEKSTERKIGDMSGFSWNDIALKYKNIYN